MNTVERVVGPFPVKESPAKSNMTSSSSSSNEQLRFDPKFNNLPAPSDADRYDSGLDSYRSVGEYCLSGGLEHVEQSFRGLKLSSAQTEINRTPTDDQQFDVEDTTEKKSEDEIQLTPDAFDQDQEGDTPLHMAIIHEDDISLQFIKYAPSMHHLDIANNLLQTPLHLSVHTKQPKVCRALVVAGVPMETMDRDGNTALHHACCQGNTECVKALTTKVTAQELQHTATQHKTIHVQQLPQNLELRNFDGLTCMHLAAASQNFHLVCYLRSIGAQIDAPDGKSGRTALHHAIEANNFNLIQYLISLGANVNALTFDNCSPLHLAVGRGLQRISLLLLEHGAQVDVLNSEGLTPAELATNQHTLMFLHQQPEYNDFQLQGL